ncbi:MULTISPECIES: MFS transporter [unclassified Rhodococcus (in: high G+C Gram-positive bacteria)]|uniref:MFS transporter n=1 Tax=unclassified Rhodococcus (in: high G+C Gram-positive bacteria) TaxID=192944 RepID=UPI0011F065BE|nr:MULTISPECIES: MFS transporter [unclassified Rhodococcus (in: high G+C Gram-positive bacteria)]KAA0923178.1 MFS transporter [Rhodococcus sp. ANT_H53B]MDI9927650.1 MFS transporter [Rhodococcus sp. IEGM 1341]
MTSARLSVLVVFFVNGAVFANWAPRIPEIQRSLSIDVATLGLALTGIGLGGLAAAPVAAALVRRFGSRWAILASGLSLCAAFVLPAVAVSWWTLLAALVLLGGADAVMDISMNAQGVLVEERAGKSLLSSFHAAWSVGAVVGGVTGAAAAGIRMPVVAHFALIAVVLMLALAAVGRGLVGPESVARVDHEDRAPGPVLVRPTAALALLGAVVLLAGLMEDFPQSWSAVYMTTEEGAGPGAAGMAFVAFSAAMLIGRLVGDRIVDRFGPSAVLTGGASLVAGAFLVILGLSLLAADLPVLVIGAFAVAGLGASPLFPIVFSLAGRLPGVSSAAAISIVSLVSRIGFLVAPLVVGRVVDASGFGSVLGAIAAAGVVVAVIGWYYGRRFPVDSAQERGSK